MINVWRIVRDWFGRRRRRLDYRLIKVSGDELPPRLEERAVYVAVDRGENWVAGMICPCGCGRRLELMLLPDVRPRWDVGTGRRGGASLHPSVWLKDGCRSHFWLKDGSIHWCRD